MVLQLQVEPAGLSQDGTALHSDLALLSGLFSELGNTSSGTASIGHRNDFVRIQTQHHDSLSVLCTKSVSSRSN